MALQEDESSRVAQLGATQDFEGSTRVAFCETAP